ncbi:MAG: nucleotidyltransferase domain-containing protein [Anaerolineales bacterium]|nr:nucleotidyltransferase domain-containing protein [Anaerolineales bacterium]
MLQHPLSSATIPRGLSVSVGETLPAAIQRIIEELNPEKIIVFGSYALGNPTADSDVDLLVIMETTEPSKERSWAISRLLLPRQFPVDIIVRTPSEIMTALEQEDTFISRILTDGLVVYERSE